MALMDEISDRGLGWPLGVGLVIAAVSAGPKLVKAGRPLLKSAIKGYLAVQEKSKEMFAETSERMQDVFAEARHEYEQEGMMSKAGARHEEEPASEPEHTAAPAEGQKPKRGRRKASMEGG